MSLFIHIYIHVLLAVLAGFIVWMIYRKPFWSFASAFLSGVLIDFDHFIDYFLAFGWSFNFTYFRRGYEFLMSNKMYTFFHGWEYGVILLIIFFISKNETAKAIFLALALGLFVHLNADVIIDKVPARSYSMVYKIMNNFDVEKLIIPEHWEKHQRERIKAGFE